MYHWKDGLKILLCLAIVGLSIAILVRQNKTEGYGAEAPMYSDCYSNCQAFYSQPNANNLTTRDPNITPTGESCIDCLTNSWGTQSMDCNYVSAYSEPNEPKNVSELCSAYKNVKANCEGSPVTMREWNKATQAAGCS